MTKQQEKYIIYGVGALAAYLLVLRPILKSFGLTKTQTEIETEAEVKKYLTSQISSGKATKSPGEWAIIADQIYEDLRYSAVSDNKSDAVYQLARVKNGADLALLIKSFGKRREYLFGIPSGSEKDLQQFVRSNLSDSQVNQVNDNYRRKNIKYQF